MLARIQEREREKENKVKEKVINENFSREKKNKENVVEKKTQPNKYDEVANKLAKANAESEAEYLEEERIRREKEEREGA